jgi:hypothetical protein
LKTVTYEDINRTVSMLVESSNYSMIIDSSLTSVYSNNTLFITLNNTSPSLPISNFTILVKNQTSGELQYLTWTGVLNSSESVNLSFQLAQLPALNPGEPVRILVKCVEGASDQITVIVL